MEKHPIVGCFELCILFYKLKYIFLGGYKPVIFLDFNSWGYNKTNSEIKYKICTHFFPPNFLSARKSGGKKIAQKSDFNAKIILILESKENIHFQQFKNYIWTPKLKRNIQNIQLLDCHNIERFINPVGAFK